MFVERDYENTSFITINNLEGSFIEDELPKTLENFISNLDVVLEIQDIFPTSFSFSLTGESEDILEAVGEIVQLLLIYNIYNFNFIYHTIEKVVE